jgi:hypothetical protein
MTRQRASQAREAFGRVGTAPVPASDSDSDLAGASAGAMAGDAESLIAAAAAGTLASVSASENASQNASSKAGGKAGRRVGRPRGPRRVALTVRVLAATNDRLTERTGRSPQYIVDEALANYLRELGV